MPGFTFTFPIALIGGPLFFVLLVDFSNSVFRLMLILSRFHAQILFNLNASITIQEGVTEHTATAKLLSNTDSGFTSPRLKLQ